MTKHLMDPTFLVMSLPEWRKFNATEQQMLQKGASLGGEIVKAMAPRREAESLAAVKKLGMKVHEIDLAPMIEAATPAQNELAKEFGAEALLAQIRSAK
jgi:TRAP-type C4-dicarboxylate transport system substrate-binding protein